MTMRFLHDPSDVATTSLVSFGLQNTNCGGQVALHTFLIAAVPLGLFRRAASSCGLDERSKVDEGLGGLHERVLYHG